jgi:3-hydroxybutyryl-CoA dehydratase
MTYDSIQLGETACLEKTISETDIYAYAGIVGDFNPVHVNQRFAEHTKFGARIAHGMLVSGLFSAVFAMKLPGEGAVYISQDLRFVAPVYIGDTIKAAVRVSEKLEKGRVRFECIATNQRDMIVISGTAVLLVSRQ